MSGLIPRREKNDHDAESVETACARTRSSITHAETPPAMTAIVVFSSARGATCHKSIGFELPLQQDLRR